MAPTDGAMDPTPPSHRSMVHLVQGEQKQVKRKRIIFPKGNPSESHDDVIQAEFGPRQHSHPAAHGKNRPARDVRSPPTTGTMPQCFPRRGTVLEEDAHINSADGWGKSTVLHPWLGR